MRSRLRGFAVAAALAAGAAAPALAGEKPLITFVDPPPPCACRPLHTSSTVTFKLAVSNFKLSAADFGKAPVAGEGHLLFSLDKGKFDHPRYSGANGRLAVEIGTAGRYSPAVKPRITYRNLPLGKHELVVRLARNDHRPVGQPASIVFTVQ